jgi:sulfur-oxidizing protein SoxY
MTDPFSAKRRDLLKYGISATTLALVASSGLLLPQKLLAHWPVDAFTAETVEDALLALLGEAEEVNDTLIRFSVGAPPSYAVNGASVPVEINSDLEDIQRIAILVDKNPFPLAASIDLTPAVFLPFKTMIKVAEDAKVIVIIRAGDTLYRTTRDIAVDIGGCA